MNRCLLFSLLVLSVMVGGCSGVDLPPSLPGPPPAAAPDSFVDPTATLQGQVALGHLVYVAPFARLQAGSGQLGVGAESNVQDNVLVDSDAGREVVIGDHVILAHGCSVEGPARIGEPGGTPAFVGFNAQVQGGVVEPGAMVLARARLGPGLILRRGFKILSGRNVTTQAEADQPGLGKVAEVTAADLKFMEGVLEVNHDLAVGYSQLQVNDPQGVSGIGPDPITPLHPEQVTPSVGGVATRDALFRNRIIGDVRLADRLDLLSARLGNRDSLRADEGGPFVVGHLAGVQDEVTFHALEHSEIDLGEEFQVGRHAVIHGGEDLKSQPPEVTRIGDRVTVGPMAVVFRSTLGDGCVIGEGALVENCQLAPGTVVPDRTILIDNQSQGLVEW